MILETKTYSVDKVQFENYIKLTQKTWITKALIIFGILISLEAFIVYNLDKEFPFLIFFIATFIAFVAFLWGQSMWTETLRKFKDATYELTSKGLTIKRPDIETRQLNFNEIAVTDQGQKGTVFVKGNKWTKLNYYRPKISGNPIDLDDRIFVPTVTKDYKELIEKIKNACQQTAANSLANLN